ncbi:MAG TPA: metal ABC transporter substrate-binding protein, partial [Actinomycetota bacterium]|nr:metal ABC transporter substrate-binding protein [Actinomycetota bacterium]
MPRLILLCLLVLLPACQGASDPGRPTVVAAVYPLAYVAERIGGPAVEVIDLTPAGSDAHDVELSLEDRAAIEEADVVVYMGQLGFQPQVEAAVADAAGHVVDASRGDQTLAAGEDPHRWLDPIFVRDAAEDLAEAIASADPARADAHRQRAARLVADLDRLADEVGVEDCSHHTAIVTHEAFASLLPEPFRQHGLAGADPEGEPTSDRLREAARLVRAGDAGAVFYEETDEGRRVGT